MKIAVLEWICGGGLAAREMGQIPLSLRQEGFLMLGCVARQLSKAGHEVLVAFDPRSIHESEQNQLANYADIRCCSNASLRSSSIDEQWFRIAHAADLVLVIAPELDGVLQRVVKNLRASGLTLANCRGEFMSSASDKLATAKRLHRHGVSHPATRLLVRSDLAWLARHRCTAAGWVTRWVIKPRDGAGCEGLQLLSDNQLIGFLSSSEKIVNDDSHILQPWLEGQAFSVSAIVDRGGRYHWLPLVTQQLVGAGSLHYCGGDVMLDENGVQPPTELLESAVAALGPGALGWIGIDLIYDHRQDRWTIIEVNPRFTSSIESLTQSADGNLLECMVRAVTYQHVDLPTVWKPASFRLSPVLHN